MKKMIFTIVLALGCLCGTGAAAQTDNTAYRQSLQDYLESSGSMASFEVVLDRLFRMSGALSDQEQSEVRGQAFDKLIDLLFPIYSKHVAREDLAAAVRFYRTPEGMRLAQAQSRIAVESTEIGREWVLWCRTAVRKAGR